jgi:hypothetical protein
MLNLLFSLLEFILFLFNFEFLVVWDYFSPIEPVSSIDAKPNYSLLTFKFLEKFFFGVSNLGYKF